MKEKLYIKHDMEENWKKAKNFVPKLNELIIYDGIVEDDKYLTPPRFKIGDGVKNVNDLDFLAIPLSINNASIVEKDILKII